MSQPDWRKRYISARNRLQAPLFSKKKDLPIYQDPEVFAQNCVEPHTPLKLLTSKAQALDPYYDPQIKSKWIQTLASPDRKGKCLFRLFTSPTAFTEDDVVKRNKLPDTSPQSEVSDWQQIEIPSCWQLHENSYFSEQPKMFHRNDEELYREDVPIYTNIRYPFQRKSMHSTDVPSSDRENPVGVYRLNFSVPREWTTKLEVETGNSEANSEDDIYEAEPTHEILSDREIRLVLHGGGSGLKVFVNGVYLGYGQDSMTETEFIVPSSLLNVDRLGENDEFVGNHNCLVVIVYKYTDGSYLEDQDQWYLSGIFREIELQCVVKSPAQIKDYKIQTTTPANLQNLGGDTTTGLISVDVTLLADPSSNLFQPHGDGNLNPWQEEATQVHVVGQEPINGAKPAATFSGQIMNAFNLSPSHGPESMMSTIMVDVDNFESHTKMTNKGSSLGEQFVSKDFFDSDNLFNYPLLIVASVYSATGNLVTVGRKPINNLPRKENSNEYSFTLDLQIPNAKLWSPTQPYLYQIFIELITNTRNDEEDVDNVDVESKVLQTEFMKTGIRSVDIQNGQILLNGREILICGVNRHEFCPEGGKVMTEELIQEDLALIKRHNFNAVRCSHYPNRHRFYELCDELGLLVVDEANIETHGFSLVGQISKLHLKKEWHPQIQYRIKSMVKRAKNYTCIIGWSLGNEAGSGPHLRSVVRWIREYENFYQKSQILPKDLEGLLSFKFSGRFIQYEGGIYSGDTPLLMGDGQDIYLTDVICPMYFSPKKLLKALKKDNRRVFAAAAKLQQSKLFNRCQGYDATAEERKTFLDELHLAKFRPVVLCEYSHAMGNSSGNMHLYWKLFKSSKYKQIQGGFIWDLVDQGLPLNKQSVHNKDWAYGGDFGLISGVEDKNFCINGIVFPDRSPHPALFEAKYLMQPIDFQLKNQKVKKKDKAYYIIATFYPHAPPLSSLEFEWKIYDQEVLEPVSTGTFSFAAAQGINDKINYRFMKKATLGLQNAFTAVKELEGQGKKNLTLQLRAKLAHDTDYGSKNLVVVQENIKVSSKRSKIRDIDDEEDDSTTESRIDNGVEEIDNGGLLHFKGNNYIADFNTYTGKITKLSTKEEGDILAEGTNSITFSFYRAATDNDNGGTDHLFDNMLSKIGQKVGYQDFYSHNYYWVKYGLDNMVSETVYVQKLDWKGQQIKRGKSNSVRFLVKERHGPKAGSVKVRFITYMMYSFFSDRVELSCEVEAVGALKKCPTLPRVGVKLEVSSQFQHCNYLGMGPFETYPDRKSGARFGVFNEQVNNFHVPYIKPSECGGRADVRWVQFLANDGDNFRVHFNQLEAKSSYTPEEKKIRDANKTTCSEAFARAFAENFPEGLDQYSNFVPRDETFPGFTEFKKLSKEEAAKQKEVGVHPLKNVLQANVALEGELSFRAAGMTGAQLNVSKFTVEELDKADHQSELPSWNDVEARPTQVLLDTAHMGLGGDNSWLPASHKQYRVRPGIWRFQLCIQPGVKETGLKGWMKDNTKGEAGGTGFTSSMKNLLQKRSFGGSFSQFLGETGSANKSVVSQTTT
eukprot:snap_masked-scaffold_50-processed-gene-0.12-mRNA-1 protein AED:1.00 eAED:1.00 QI:0/0/0/0/1/1/2/0/1554